MVLVKHLISPAALPKPPISLAPSLLLEHLSVLSYNILLPNSVDAWWTYKMYGPPLPKELQYQSSWEYRRDLLKKRVELVNADVVCFQEVSPKSFEQDFEFMQALGYDGVELFKKGRFRPATFWKTSHCELAMPSVHKDRCLLTAFRLNNNNNNNNNPTTNNNNDSTQQNWYICNVHLQAGNKGPRRVRQINEAIRGIMTMARKQKGTKRHNRSCPFFIHLIKSHLVTCAPSHQNPTPKHRYD
jgi:mRNA deadenylase 3'-5' endonuclease subunit Ccr4